MAEGESAVMDRARGAGLVAAALLLSATPPILSGAALAAAAPAIAPEQLAYRDRSGAALPRLPLHDAGGEDVRLVDLAQGRPLILVLGYFRCPNLCGVVRASLFRALALARLMAGRDYALAVVSIDPGESAADAARARDHDLAAFEVRGRTAYIHFLTASPAAIRAVADAVGFRDQPDAAASLARPQWIHPAGIVFATADGTISSYLLGVGYRPEAVRLALARAAARSIVAQTARPILLLCFHFDASTGRYSLEILKLLRLGAILACLVLAAVLYLLFRRERRAP